MAEFQRPNTFQLDLDALGSVHDCHEATDILVELSSEDFRSAQELRESSLKNLDQILRRTKDRVLQEPLLHEEVRVYRDGTDPVFSSKEFDTDTEHTERQSFRRRMIDVLDSWLETDLSFELRFLLTDQTSYRNLYTSAGATRFVGLILTCIDQQGEFNGFEYRIDLSEASLHLDELFLTSRDVTDSSVIERSECVAPPRALRDEICALLEQNLASFSLDTGIGPQKHSSVANEETQKLSTYSLEISKERDPNTSTLIYRGYFLTGPITSLVD